jgi:hypothetical protein
MKDKKLQKKIAQLEAVIDALLKKMKKSSFCLMKPVRPLININSIY